jgi:hypothetical protein
LPRPGIYSVSECPTKTSQDNPLQVCPERDQRQTITTMRRLLAHHPFAHATTIGSANTGRAKMHP